MAFQVAFSGPYPCPSACPVQVVDPYELLDEFDGLSVTDTLQQKGKLCDDLEKVVQQAGSNLEALAQNSAHLSTFLSLLLGKEIPIVEETLRLFQKPSYQTIIFLTITGIERESFPDAIEKISVKFPNICTFTSKNSRLSREALVKIVTTASKMHSLTLQHLNFTSSKQFLDVPWPTNLQNVFFFNCKIDDAGANSILARCPLLTSLKFYKCLNITLSSTPLVGRNVQKLVLNGCNIDDASITTLEEKFPRLQDLSISECPKITDKAFAGLAPPLSHLELHRLKNVNFARMQLPTTLKGLHLLEVHVTGEVLQALMQQCHQLQALSLVRCNAISQEAFSKLTYLSTLEKVHFEGTNIDLEGVNTLLLEVSSLKYAVFKTCSNLPVEFQQNPLNQMQINHLLTKLWQTVKASSGDDDKEVGVFEME